MIGLGGLDPLTAFRVAETTRDGQIEALRERPTHARAIAAIRERGGAPLDAAAFVADAELYAATMVAFGLEDRIFGKGMMRKVLASDAADPESLVNRLSDPRFRSMHAALGFGAGDVPRLGQPTVQEAVVDRYLARRFTDGVTEQSAPVGAALAFREAAPGIGTAYDILRDPELSTVVRTALGIPAAAAGIDIDRQAQMIEARLDLSTLAEPEAVDRLLRKYLVLSGVTAGPSPAAAGVLSLLSGPQAGGLIEIASIYAARRG